LAARKMSKKNNLAKRKKQHEFDLQREKEAKEKLAKKLQAKKSKMKIDGDVKRKGGKFKVGKKKVKTKLSALTKAKAAQAMEVDK
jgi:cytochrome c biogenesis protein ResB